MFRSANFHDAWAVLQSHFQPGEPILEFITDTRVNALSMLMLVCALIAVAMPHTWKTRAERVFVEAPALAQAAVCIAVASFIGTFAESGVAFIYFQF